MLVNAQGRLLADSDASLLNRFERDAFAGEALLGRQARDARGRVWLFVERRAARGLSLLYLQLQPRLPVVAFLVEGLFGPLAQASLTALCLSVLLAAAVARSLAEPLRRMARAAQGIARGQFDQALPLTGPAEVQALAGAFNDMAQQVGKSQQAQRDFVANVSHELKTPLTSIQGFSQAILDGAAESPEARRRSASIIYDEAERMRRLVEGLLDLARLDAGEPALARGPLDLAALLRSVGERLALRAGERGVALRQAIGPLPALTGDSDRLAQVFTNLLDNALKHTPAGGTVTLAAAGVDGGAEVTVTDTGPGIPAEDLSRIFERFYQVDKSRRASGRGAGLGLAISREIVHAHGGQIHAESVMGLGTKFVVRLPASRNP
jgi:signal transduction histidine kinase